MLTVGLDRFCGSPAASHVKTALDRAACCFAALDSVGQSRSQRPIAPRQDCGSNLALGRLLASKAGQHASDALLRRLPASRGLCGSGCIRGSNGNKHAY